MRGNLKSCRTLGALYLCFGNCGCCACGHSAERAVREGLDRQPQVAQKEAAGWTVKETRQVVL